MSTKMDRVTVYIKHLNHEPSEKEVTEELENLRNSFIEFAHVAEIKRTDIGEWHDDHELNYGNVSNEIYESYYKEISND